MAHGMLLTYLVTTARGMLSCLATAGILATGASAHAQTCEPSRLMVVLDQSSSMVTGSIGGQTKWSIATGALDQVATQFEDKLQLGLMKYPNPNECSPGSVFVGTATGNKSAIMAELTTAPPTSGNWTPMSQTLDVAATVSSLQQSDVPNYVVLVTDGWQYCDPYDGNTRFDAVDSVATLKGLGITTYVVGFGASVDALALNSMAVEGGTAQIGCNPQGDSPGAANPCYYQADDSSDLIAALTEIANNASTEVCDGIDNDCDGQVDEGLVQACSTDCGAGTEICVNGNWQGCNAPLPGAEVCDGDDNNCDGAIDEGCDCSPGQSRDCGEEEEEGECQPGTQTCGNDGTWGDCQGSQGPLDEVCDGGDNDCDGLVDEYITEGEVFGTLCGPGLECVNGSCDPVPGAAPPDEEEEDPDTEPLPAADGGTASGCACRVGSPDAAGLAGSLLLGLFGAVFALRRRRRSY